MAEAAAGPTLRTDSDRMESQLRILLRKHLGFPRHDIRRLEKIGLRDFRDILCLPLWQVPTLWDRLKTKPGKQVLKFMAFCYWFRENHRTMTPDGYLHTYAERRNGEMKKSMRIIRKWLKDGAPQLHKRHYWAHVRPKGKRVNYDDPADDESNCITLSDPELDAEEWEPGYEDPVGISVEPNQEDGFVTDMEDHGPDWDEDTIHIEVEDDLRLRNLEEQGVEVEEWGEYIRTHRARSIPTVLRFTQADFAAGMWQGRGQR